jgi:hypothetical protein
MAGGGVGAREGEAGGGARGGISSLLSDELGRRDAALVVAPEKFRKFAKRVTRVSSARAEISEKAEAIREACRLGVGTPTELPEPVMAAEATRATTLWVGSFVEDEAAPSMAE